MSIIQREKPFFMGGSLDADTIVVTAGVTRLGEFLSIVFFVQFFDNYKISPNFLATIYNGENYVLLLGNNGLGDFFKNSSGHPGYGDIFFPRNSTKRDSKTGHPSARLLF
jgi:hypothetical protein